MPPNRPVRLEVQAVNETETQRSETIDMVYVPPPQPPAETRPAPVIEPVRPSLVVLGIGNDKFQAREIPPIRFADKDATSLADFLGKHLLMPDAKISFASIKVERSILVNKPAESLQQALGKLQEMPRNGGLHKGDLVVLVVNSHVLEWEGSSVIAATDTAITSPPGPLLSGRDLAERLGELADYGCRVVLFLDGVHDLGEGPLKSEIKSWVRDLQRNRRVITFVASKEIPSGASIRDQHGYFTQGLLNAFQAAGAVAPRRHPAGGLTLEFFLKAVRQEVQNLSNRRQEVGCYIPPAVAPSIMFARP